MHRAIRAKEIIAEQLVRRYSKRIEASNGTCVKGAVDPTTGLILGENNPIKNAGQVNACMTLNIRGTLEDNSPIMTRRCSTPLRKRMRRTPILLGPEISSGRRMASRSP
jgi:hypothetical protein